MSDTGQPGQPGHEGPPTYGYETAPMPAYQPYPAPGNVPVYQGQPSYGYPGAYPQTVMVAPKNPGVALLCSFFIIGLGQLVNGEGAKGVAFFVGAVLAWVSLFVLVGFLLLPAVWIWSMVDAYQTAKQWNLRHGILS